MPLLFCLRGRLRCRAHVESRVMESEFAFDRRAEVMRVTIRGPVDGADLVKLGTQTAERVAKVRPKGIVYDFTDVTSVSLPTTQVDSLAHQRPILAPEVKQVILAPQDFLYGLARMFQAMAAETRPNVQVARNWVEAHHLLGVSEPPVYAPIED